MTHLIAFALALAAVNCCASENTTITIHNSSRHDFMIYYHAADGTNHGLSISPQMKLNLLIFNPSQVVFQRQGKPEYKAIDIGTTPPLTFIIESSGVITFKQEGARIIPSLEYVSQNSSSGSSYSSSE